MSQPDPAPTFDALLQEIVTAAGGVRALAQKAEVEPALLRKWGRGQYPIERVSDPLQRVDSWARRNMKGTYPPSAWPAGLCGFVGRPPNRDDQNPQPTTEPDPTDTAQEQGEPDPAERTPPPGPEATPEPPPTPPPPPPWWSAIKKYWAYWVALLATLILIAGVVWWWSSRPSADPQVSAPIPGSRTIVVQNKVAFGPSSLAEDDSPSYLSSRPVARCVKFGCKLDGTDVATGDTLQAVCQLQGELMTNADVGSAGIKTNPNVAGSALWYGVVWRDGRRGFISEVYVAPTFRGGLGLPAC